MPARMRIPTGRASQELEPDVRRHLLGRPPGCRRRQAGARCDGSGHRGRCRDGRCRRKAPARHTLRNSGQGGRAASGRAAAGRAARGSRSADGAALLHRCGHRSNDLRHALGIESPGSSAAFRHGRGRRGGPSPHGNDAPSRNGRAPPPPAAGPPQAQAQAHAPQPPQAAATSSAALASAPGGPGSRGAARDRGPGSRVVGARSVRPVRDSRADRRWRHGGALEGAALGRRGISENRRYQEDPSASGRQRGVHRDVRRRGQARGAAQPPEHRPHLRSREDRFRRVLHRHGVRRGAGSARHPPVGRGRSGPRFRRRSPSTSLRRSRPRSTTRTGAATPRGTT